MFCDEKTGQMSFVAPAPKFDKTSRLWQEFLIFHKNHPEVYEKYKQEIIDAFRSGKDLYSVQVIMENNRWNERRKIKNNHAPYYARLFIEENPQYKGFFRLRSVKKD
jgi:hypothetical protein